MIQCKRIYDPPSAGDGCRILVDRLWPRGVARDDARLDDWLKELAPSNELRRWFGHDPGRWEEFQERYRAELAGQGPTLERLQEMAARGPVTLLFAAKDEKHNNAVVLQELLNA